MSGLDQINQMRAAGFSDDEVQTWQTGQMQKMAAAGFSPTDINSYFGVHEPNDAGLDKYIKANMEAHKAANPGKPLSIMDAIDAGWQSSTAGLIANGKMPQKQITKDDPWYNRAAANTAQLIGDIPAMIVGGVAGGAGGAETGPGMAVTATAGAFAVPTALRLTLMDAYQHGGFKNFQDFWDRFTPIAINTAKSYATGAATAGAGVIAGKALAGAAPMVKTVGQVSAELGTMTTVGKALEGEVPEWQDFVDGALVLGAAKAGLRAATGVTQTVKATTAKLADVYRATGTHPARVIADAKSDPTIAQDLLSNKPGIPQAYKEQIDPNLPPEMASAAKGEPVEKAVEPAPTEHAVEPVQIEPGSLEDAQKQILDKVNTQVPDTKTGATFDDFYRAVVDRLDPVRQAVTEMAGKSPDTVADPYKLLRLIPGMQGKAVQFLEHGAFDFKTYENNAPSLKAILDPHQNDLDGFRAYMVARRAVELEDRGITSGMPVDAAKKVLAETSKKYEEAFQRLQEYQNSLSQYLRDAGILSDSAYAAMRQANKAYVPFNRVMDEPSDGFGMGVKVRNPIKAIKGSSRDVIDPLETIVRNTYAFINLAERNAAAKAFYDLASKSETPEAFYQEVPARMAVTKVSDPEMSKFLKDNGIEDMPNDALTVFRAVRQPLAKDEIGFFDEGKYKVIKVDPDIAEAFNGLPPAQHGLLFKLLSVPAKLFRAGLVVPEFIMRHLLRNQMSASMLTEDTTIPFWDTFKAIPDVLGKSEAYQNWLKSGGSMVSAIDMDRNNVQVEVRRLAGQDPAANFLDKAWNVAKTPMDVLHAIQSTLESATRVGAFKKSLGGTSKEDILSAGYASRNIAPDPARIGDMTRNWNAITALFNIEIQHTDQLVGALRERPLGTLAKIFAGITIPSALLWLNNHDKDEWREAHQWERDAFWLVPMGDFTLRIPKPFLLGTLFGSSVERMLDAVAGNDPGRQGKEFARNVLEQGVPHVIPTAITPLLEQITNYSFFRGGPLVPDRVQKLLPEYRYTEYTSELSKQLGHIVGSVPYVGETSIASPIVINNYVNQWLGGAGAYALQIADAGLRKAGVLPNPVKPDDTLADIPLVKAFVVRYPSATADSLQHFHEQYTERKMTYDTFTELAKRGDVDAAVKVMKANPVNMVKLDGIEKTLSEQTNLVRLIYANPDIPGAEKRQLIDATYYQMIQLAHAGNDLMKQLDEMAPELSKPGQ